MTKSLRIYQDIKYPSFLIQNQGPGKKGEVNKKIDPLREIMKILINNIMTPK